MTERFHYDEPNQADQADEAALPEMPPPEASQALVPAVAQTTVDNAGLGHVNKTLDSCKTRTLQTPCRRPWAWTMIWLKFFQRMLRGHQWIV